MQKILDALAAKDSAIAVVGLGYVGLPLACLLAKKYRVVGFDINAKRVEELRSGYDRTGEIPTKSELQQANLSYASDPAVLGDCRFVIVAVPTPVDRFRKPDLGPVIGASKTIGRHLKPGAIVIYESTVYPGVTEDICVPVLEGESQLKHGRDFWVGYSPERVNPGDREHTIDRIVKVVSGSTPEVTKIVGAVYGSVIPAGIHYAPSIKTAEAAKVIENTQRDINIALVNELAMLFDKIGLDTLDVLAAAGTKWNFLKFQPGLVGGHCIGVDPYYLTHMAEGLEFHPQMIRAGRRINDGMGAFVGQKALRLLLSHGNPAAERFRVGILGVTFKENVPDIRNTKVVSIADYLKEMGVDVQLCDPVADAEEFHEEYGWRLQSWESLPQCDAIIVAVKHAVFESEINLPKLKEKLGGANVVLDLKGIYSREQAAASGITLWRL